VIVSCMFLGEVVNVKNSVMYSVTCAVMKIMVVKCLMECLLTISHPFLSNQTVSTYVYTKTSVIPVLKLLAELWQM
jgi:hypothetical protein